MGATTEPCGVASQELQIVETGHIALAQLAAPIAHCDSDGARGASPRVLTPAHVLPMHRIHPVWRRGASAARPERLLRKPRRRRPLTEAALQGEIGSAAVAGAERQATASCGRHRCRAVRNSVAAPKLTCAGARRPGGCGFCARSPPAAGLPPLRCWASRVRRSFSRSPRSCANPHSRLPQLA